MREALSALLFTAAGTALAVSMYTRVLGMLMLGMAVVIFGSAVLVHPQVGFCTYWRRRAQERERDAAIPRATAREKTR